jgi:hypothetical protein
MHSFIATLRHLGGTISLALCKLNEIQFSAPWDAARPRCGE